MPTCEYTGDPRNLGSLTGIQCEPGRRPIIRQELDETNASLEEVASVLKRLTERLQPVMQMKPEKDSNPKDTPSSGVTLGDEIRSINQRIRGVARVVRYILESIEI